MSVNLYQIIALDALINASGQNPYLYRLLC